MTINPSEVQLSPEQQLYIARQAERTGRPWPQLLGTLVPAGESAPPRSESALAVAERLGLVGSCDGDPADLATNSRHLEGFGQ